VRNDIRHRVLGVETQLLAEEHRFATGSWGREAGSIPIRDACYYRVVECEGHTSPDGRGGGDEILRCRG
jgi:hypothetical protein